MDLLYQFLPSDDFSVFTNILLFLLPLLLAFMVKSLVTAMAPVDERREEVKGKGSFNNSHAGDGDGDGVYTITPQSQIAIIGSIGA
jgi:hypothetical protein